MKTIVLLVLLAGAWYIAGETYLLEGWLGCSNLLLADRFHHYADALIIVLLLRRKK